MSSVFLENELSSNIQIDFFRWDKMDGSTSIAYTPKLIVLETRAFKIISDRTDLALK